MILLVEDDEDVREMLEFSFQSSGMAVRVVGDGKAALEVLDEERPCLMIIDLVMPKMTGWELVEQMKTRRFSDVPFCVISALGGSAPANAVASFCKPFDVRELVTLAARYCRHATAG